MFKYSQPLPQKRKARNPDSKGHRNSHACVHGEAFLYYVLPWVINTLATISSFMLRLVISTGRSDTSPRGPGEGRRHARARYMRGRGDGHRAYSSIMAQSGAGVFDGYGGPCQTTGVDGGDTGESAGAHVTLQRLKAAQISPLTALRGANGR